MWVSNIIQKHTNKLIIFKTQLTVKWQKFAAKNDSIQRSHHLLLARMQHSKLQLVVDISISCSITLIKPGFC